MDNKKLFAFIFVMIFMISVVSALDFAIDNYKVYDDKIGDYGKIIVWDIGQIADDKILTEIILEKNTDQCLINCEASGTAILHTDGKLFNDIKFSEDINSYQFYILKTRTIEDEVIDYDMSACTKPTEEEPYPACDGKVIGSHITSREEEYWDVYDFETLDAGEYEWKLKGTKDKGVTTDWIAEAFGQKLDEWAWWSGDWAYRKEVNITGGTSTLTNFTILLNVSYEANMQSDFDDLRFVDGECSGVQDTENDYEIEYTIDEKFAFFWVQIPSLTTGNNNVCMYYGNAGASSSSDGTASWDANYLFVYHGGEYVNSVTGARGMSSGGALNETGNVNCFAGTMCTNLVGDGNIIYFNESGQNEFATGQLEAWINKSGTNTYGIGVSMPYDTDDLWDAPYYVYGLIHHADVNKEMGGQISPDATSTNGDLGTWVQPTFKSHWVVSYDGTNERIWLNGSLNNTVNPDGNGNLLYNGDPVLTLGAGNSYSQNEWWHGYLDEVRVSNVVRDSAWTNRTIYDNNLVGTIFSAEEENVGVSATQNYPLDNYNTTDNTVNMACNFSRQGSTLIEIVKLDVYDSADNLDYTNTESGLSLLSYNKTWTTSALTDDDYKWSCFVTGDGAETGSAGNRTLIVDTLDPALEIIKPSSNDIGLNSHLNISLNWTVSDIHLQACWYYNKTGNTTVTCGNNATIQVSAETYNFIVYANDTHGNENSSSKSYSYSQASVSTYESSDPTVEGNSVTYGLWVNITDTPTVYANLTWDGVNYTATRTPTTHYTYFERDIAIPEGTGNATGKEIDWYWNYDITGIGVTSTALDNTTVINISADDCGSYPIQILNLSLKDEEKNTFVNVAGTNTSNVEVDVYLLSQENESILYHFYNQYTDDVNPVVCIPDGILNSTNLTIEFTIGFGSTDHVNEFYYLDNGTLQNDLEAISVITDRHINLRDLLTADSTSFLFNFFDVDGLPIENSIAHVFRRYIGDGDFREVERSKQDENGNTIVHLVEEDVIYYFILTLEGDIIYTSSQYTALCQSVPCTIQLEESGGFQEFTNDWDLIENGGYVITSSSSTREVNLTYVLTSPSTMNLTVYKLDGDGVYSSVGSEQEFGMEGSLVITVPTISGNTTFFASVYQDGVFKKSKWEDFSEDARFYLGDALSLFLGALIILAFGLIAISEGAGVIIFLLLGMFIAMILGLVDYRSSVGINVLIYFIIAGGIIVWKLTRRKLR